MAANQAHGFASLNGGTSGGSGGDVVTVRTGQELQAAIDSVGPSSRPLTIMIAGTITPGNSPGDAITIEGRDNISLIGAGSGAEFDGIGIRVTDGSSNLIIQNLKIHDVATGPKDAIGIEGPSRNIWIDHNELYSSLSVSKDYYDGLLDIKRGAEYITVSNNYFHDHHKTSLVGYSDSDTGGRHITYDHNVFANVESRTPSVRDGEVHIYNNYYTDIGTSGINLRMGAVGLVEGNVFEDVHNPIVSLDSKEPGYWELNGNLLTDVTWGSVGSGEASAKDGRSTGSYDAPYAYDLEAAGSVKADVLANAGVGHLGSGGTAPTPPVVTPPTKPPVTPPPTTPTPPDQGGGSTPKPTPGSVGTDKADALAGTAGDDRIDGKGGYDVIRGLDGRDSLEGGDGRDQLFGDAGDDTLSGGSGDDALQGGVGADVLLGGDGRDKLDGGDGVDALDGGRSADALAGGAGDDRLLGGGGADTLDGGAGNDVLAGGEGRDVFHFAAGESGRDVIQDFAVGSDTLSFAGYAESDLRVADGAAGATVTVGSQTILLQGVHLGQADDGWLFS